VPQATQPATGRLRLWHVREVSCKDTPGARASHCLLCESENVVRRIWEYPPDWHLLSDDDLQRLCEQ
jgi:hypothetical protein